METIDELKSRLRQAQKLEAIGKLAAGVAHEINTPMQFLGDNLCYLSKTFDFLVKHLEKLNSPDRQLDDNLSAEIASEWQTIQDKSILEQIKEALDDSRDGVEQVSRTVSALKAFSHPGGLDKTSVNVNQSIKTALTVSRNEWKYVAHIDQDLCEDLPFVIGDAGDLNQVFLNLIVNAAHAIAEKKEETSCRGEIRISTSYEDGFVCVVIEDTGCGIPASVGDKVFSPMYTTKGPGEGTGLGLAIAHSVITEKHKGRISFQSEKNRGTRFVIEFPVDKASAQDTPTNDLDYLNLIRD